MKKYILLGAGLLIAASSFAQKGKIRDASASLRDNDYKRAISSINEAAVNPDTKDNPETWRIRGAAYLEQKRDPNGGNPAAVNEAYTSLMKAISLKPDYAPEDVNNALYMAAVYSFNDGVEIFDTDPKGAYERFARVLNVYKLNGGNRFAKDTAFRSIAVSARTNAAIAAVKAQRDDVALGLYKEVIASGKDANAYMQVIDIYGRQKNDAEELNAITEARKAFPDNDQLRNLEINYYVRTGKSDQLLSKLEEAVASKPNDAEMVFSLANMYMGMAWPDKGEKPANQAELIVKSDAAYQKATSLAPDSAEYYYNHGVLFYKAATDLTERMKAITGNTPADEKKYNGLLAMRNAQFGKALPFLETGEAIYAKKGVNNLTQADKFTYESILRGLREIYSRNDNAAKSKEVKEKLEALK